MSDSTRRRIEDIIASGDVILFMKGVPAAPQCGFSAAVVQILSQLAVPFKSVDVLSDLEVREGIKAFSNWPTHAAALCQGRARWRLRHRHIAAASMPLLLSSVASSPA